MPAVLVVDDDATVREIVVAYLDNAGLTTLEAADGQEALVTEAEHRPDLVVLDLMMPVMDGLTACAELRERRPDLPIIMLTARGSQLDRIAGLEAGADDYVVKPFSPRELTLRVQSVLRRSSSATRPAEVAVIRDGDLELNLDARTATLAGQEITLTVREFDLLRFLVTHPGTVYSRTELLTEVWGWSFGDDSTVTVHVRRLREKVERDPSNPSRISTVWGRGYRWDQHPGQGD